MTDPTPIDVRDEPETLADLLGRLASDLTLLFRKEIELAKVELREEAGRAGKAAGMLVAGGIAGFVTVLLLAFALAWGLAEVIPAGFAFLVVALIFGAVAAVCLAQGRTRMQQVKPVPEQTVATVKEDVQWAKTQMR